MPTTSPQFDKMIEVLKDGIWRDREWVINEIGKAIPPGVAIRRAELLRVQGVRQRKKQGLKVTAEHERKIARSNDYLARAGRRNLALTALQSVRIETREHGDVVQVRLLPPKPHHRTAARLAREAASAN